MNDLESMLTELTRLAEEQADTFFDVYYAARKILRSRMETENEYNHDALGRLEVAAMRYFRPCRTASPPIGPEGTHHFIRRHDLNDSMATPGD